MPHDLPFGAVPEANRADFVSAVEKQLRNRLKEEHAIKALACICEQVDDICKRQRAHYTGISFTSALTLYKGILDKVQQYCNLDFQYPLQGHAITSQYYEDFATAIGDACAAMFQVQQKHLDIMVGQSKGRSKGRPIGR